MYPFGFGLTYSTTGLDGLDVQHVAGARTVKVGIDVSNTGSRDEEQVVQAYVRNLHSALAPRNGQLAAFRRIALKAGECRHVVLDLDPNAFLVVNDECRHKPAGSALRGTYGCKAAFGVGFV